MAVLVDAGFLVSQQVIASTLDSLDAATLCWAPGDPTPDAGAVAWKLQSRWKEPARVCRCFVATTKAAKHFGGRASGRLKRELQASHDLGVTEMYLQMRHSRPEQARLWIGEDLLAPYRKHEKLPDAVLADSPSATPSLVLEFGGAYNKDRVLAFHHDCESRSLPYELW